MSTERADFDAVVIGAGFAGLYQLHRLRDTLGLSVKLIEKAEEVGGTWYWNRYPGARCDSESHLYCYSFSDEILKKWQWSKRYPNQPEILEYLQFVADHLDLRRDIEFETEVTEAIFDEAAGHWEVVTDDGSRVSARFLITAVGSISEPFIPEFDGIDSFEEEWIHTARWPHDPVDFAGKQVAVIGTGATGVQVIPKVAEKDIEHLTVFQRTPNYATPARDRPLNDEDWEEIQEHYDQIWEEAHDSPAGAPFEYMYETAKDMTYEEVAEVLQPRWEEGGYRLRHAFADLTTEEETNKKVSRFVRNKIREAVDDPDLAEKLVPTDHYFATKRPPLHTNYFQTFNKDHVDLVDVRETPIERITPDGIRTSEQESPFDLIIFATGFDAMTGSILKMDITGRGGITMEEKWSDGPITYLGISVSGFPNLFTITGPQSPSVLANMPVSIENHVNWVTDTIGYLRENDITLIEPTESAEDEWTQHNNEVAEQTLYPTANSWYMNENIPDKPTVFTPYVGGLDQYRETLNEAAAQGYEGFKLAESVEGLDEDGHQPVLSVLESD